MGVSAFRRARASFDDGYFWLHYGETRREQQLQTQIIERRHRIAEAMHDVMAALNSDRPLADILVMIAIHSRELLHARAVSIGTLDTETGVWSVQAPFTMTASSADATNRASPPAAAQAIATGKPVITVVENDRAHQNSGVSAPATSQETTLFVPIVVEAAAFRGCMVLAYPDQSSVSQAEVELATLFAGQAVLAIENAQLKAMAQEIAARDERNRMARELHDSVTQSLYGIILNADATLLALNAGRTDKAEERLHQLKITAREAMTELRLLIYKLRPATLQEQGLVAALQERLQAVEMRSGIEVDMDVTNALTCPIEVQQDLFWIILEGLNNIVKHARAEHVQLTLAERENFCRVTLVDDGAGFDVSTATRYGGYGLKNIGERLAALGGTLSIHSQRGAGTVMEIEVPF